MVTTSQVVLPLESAAASAQLVLITYGAGGLVDPTLHAPCTPQDRVAAGSRTRVLGLQRRDVVSLRGLWVDGVQPRAFSS